MKTGQGGGDDVRRNAVRRGERYFPLVVRLCSAADFAAYFLDQIEHGDGLFMKKPSFGRQLHAFAAPVEKLHAQLRFQTLHEIADGRLLQPELFRRLGHVAAFCHGVETAKPLKKIAVEGIDHGCSRWRLAVPFIR